MNGYTPSIPVREQIKNLYVQVTDDQFLAALAHADNGNPHDFVRFLVGEALHPVEAAYQLEKAMDEDHRTEWERDWDDYCAEVQTTRREDWDVTPFPKMPNIDMDKIDEIPF